MVIGRFGPARLNAVEETVTCEIVRLDFPVLLIATGRMELLPTCTLPKFALVDEIDIWA